jgi:hypothetical protein
MRMLNFSRLYLLSQSEQRALAISFGKKPTVVLAGNNQGKSAVLKALYDSFGATPHEIDESWRSANVISIVEFTVDSTKFSIMKHAGTYTVFDANIQPLIQTGHITKELSPFFAELFDFRLVMKDRSENIITPPPAYIFSPFYIDQDKGWTATWSSFTSMYLPDSRRILAEYHSGMRPNSYYQALAARDKLRSEHMVLAAERKALDQALQQFREMASDIVLTYNLADFRQESDRLVAESNLLREEQTKYRRKISVLSEERQLWANQRHIIAEALREMNEALSDAVGHPTHVECPTCGQEYDNSLVEQFALIEDSDSLLGAALNASAQITRLDEAIERERSELGSIVESLAKIDEILAERRLDLTFRDVVAAEGRNEANKLMRERLDKIDAALGRLSSLIQVEEDRMQAAANKSRVDAIKDEFFDYLFSYSNRLDVRLKERNRFGIAGINLGRGSERPRALLAYYYAFLQTVRKHSSSVFCPLVIDAPNQQGQDARHMPAMMQFIVDEYPNEAQVIIAAESLFELSADRVQIVDVGGTENRVLRNEQYASVSDAIRPYLGQLI